MNKNYILGIVIVAMVILIAIGFYLDSFMEISSEQYDLVATWSQRDPNIKDAAKKMMKDGKFTYSEFWQLKTYFEESNGGKGKLKLELVKE